MDVSGKDIELCTNHALGTTEGRHDVHTLREV